MDVKAKLKKNLPVVLSTTMSVGAMAVSVYYLKKIGLQIEDAFPSKMKSDFFLHLSDREFKKVASGVAREVDMSDETFYLVTKDLLKDGVVSSSKVLFKN